MTPSSFRNTHWCSRFPWILLIPLALGLLRPPSAAAHCDALDGPVVTAARQALEDGDVKPALVWVRPVDEAEVRNAFAQALAVRGLSAPAREVADRLFFENLVRLHRAGEGEPFEGLKPAGRDLGPAIPAADRALESGEVDALFTLLSDQLRSGLVERFQRARAARSYPKGDVEAGRRYVATYTAFVHFVEQVHRTAEADVARHDEVRPRTPGHHD